MKLLIDLLNDKFKKTSYEDLAKYFLKTYGVTVRKFENKYLFKYDTILANYKRKITHQCRGIILYRLNNEWSYHSRVFDKFFNLEEGKHKWFSDNYLEKHLNHIRLIEKKDGSCVQVSYDRENDNFLASTLGSIQTESVFDEPYTFADLFWKTFNNAFKLEKDRTYIFELWSRENQVVTEYDKPHVTLTSIRFISDGKYADRETLEKIVEGTEVRLPIIIDKKFTTKSELILYVEEESKKEDKYGKNPEGFVAYDIKTNTPIFKQKNQKYIQYHRINLGDKRYVSKNLAIALFEGNMDDMFPNLTDGNKEYIIRLQSYLSKLSNEINGCLKCLYGSTVRREYAITVNTLLHGKDIAKYSAFFFDEFSNISVGNKVNIIDWLSKSKKYNRFIDFYKNI